MTEWKEYKLGDCVEAIIDNRGKSAPTKQNGEYPLLEINSIGGYYPNYGVVRKYVDETTFKTWFRSGHPASGDILIPTVGTIGILSIMDNKKACIAQNIIALRIKKDVSNVFIYYYLKGPIVKQELLNLDIGGVQPSIKVPHLLNLSITLPPKEAQINIASILSSLDDKIDLLHRENATLEQMAETLFRQWFVVEAKEEWEEGKLGDYVDETIGGEWGKENPEGDFIKPVQCIRGTDIADLSVGLATKTPIRYVKESKFEKIEPRNGDIIMEISGGTENQSTGRVAYVNDGVKILFDYPIIFSNFCRLLRVKEEHTYFIYCYLKYLYEQDEFFNLENGSSGIKNLDYKALLYELTYPMPNDKQQILDFNDKVSVYFEKINRNKQQIQTLIQTRDGLLPKLMSNEIAL